MEIEICWWGMILAAICSKFFLIHLDLIVCLWAERVEHCVRLSCLKSGNLIVDRIIEYLPYSIALSKV